MMMDNMDTPEGDDEVVETESAPDTGAEETPATGGDEEEAA